MRPIPLLLRVLLCLVFVANGVAGAQAAARMGAMHGTGASATMTTPCHRDADVATPSVHGAHAPPAHAAVDAPAPDRGCCAGAHCDGLCAPPLVQMPASPLLLPAFSDAIPQPRRRDDGRASPLLPHVLRPPIG